MNKTFLVQELNNIANAKRVNRLQVASLVLKNKELFKPLLELTFDFNNKLSVKAAWVLEFVCARELDLLIPYLNYFTENINAVKFDSAVRPIAKICEFLAKEYVANNQSIASKISKKHINKIVETGFDWLISNQKVAVKAYTMEMLFLFGKNIDWVHNELELIIQQNITKEIPAYQVRVKKILIWIKNK
jgi:hypothetical protein